jgi:hypothetical protein
MLCCVVLCCVPSANLDCSKLGLLQWTSLCRVTLYGMLFLFDSISIDWSYVRLYCLYRGKRSAVITIIDADVVDICMLNMKRLKIASALLVAMSSGEVISPTLSFIDRLNLTCLLNRIAVTDVQ